MKIASKRPGATASIPNASSGPIIAPVVSSARCTPNAVPSCSLGVLSEIIASRGAVRMPLPVRSSTMIAASAPTAPPAARKPSLQTAERP